MTEQVPSMTDGVSFIIVKKSLLAEYLKEIRDVYNFVPDTKIDNDTKTVMIVDRATKEPQYLIEIQYDLEE